MRLRRSRFWVVLDFHDLVYPVEKNYMGCGNVTNVTGSLSGLLQLIVDMIVTAKSGSGPFGFL